MKHTYISYNGGSYEMQWCSFYIDCIEHYDPESGKITIMPDGEWSYCESEPVIHTLTRAEYEAKQQSDLEDYYAQLDLKNECDLNSFEMAG